MLDNQTLEQLRRLRLSGMAAAFTQQLEQPELQALSFEERFSLLLDRELNLRENRRLNRLLQLARLRQQACVEDRSRFPQLCARHGAQLRCQQGADHGLTKSAFLLEVRRRGRAVSN